MRGLLAPIIKLVVFAVITIIATATLAFTIANSSGGGGTKFSAVFTDVTSLNEGDEIRIAGVRVGQVDKIEIANEREAVDALRFAHLRGRARIGTTRPRRRPRRSSR